MMIGISVDYLIMIRTYKSQKDIQGIDKLSLSGTIVVLTKTPSMIKLKVTNCKLKYLFNCFNSVETFYVSVIHYN